MRIFGLAAALVLTVVLPSSAGAVGHATNDPCAADPAAHVQTIDARTRLSCSASVNVPGFGRVTDPAPLGCPANSAPTGPNALSWWSASGSWVTPNVEMWAQDVSAMIGYHGGATAGYQNWSPWDDSGRAVLTCGPRTATARTVLTRVERGTGHHDHLHGTSGSDILLGGPGADDVHGGAGPDELFDDQGEDVLHGGPGNDRFSTRDGNHDVVECGPGDDVAIGDPHDTFTQCEHVYTTPANTPAQPPQ